MKNHITNEDIKPNTKQIEAERITAKQGLECLYLFETAQGWAFRMSSCHHP